MPVSRATLNVLSAHLTGDTITERLGLEPSRVTERGSPVLSRQPDGRRHDETVWSLESAVEGSRPLSDHLSDLLRRVEERRARVDRLIEDGCQIDWFCYLEAVPTGQLVSLDAELLLRLGTLGGPVTLDLYEGGD